MARAYSVEMKRYARMLLRRVEMIICYDIIDVTPMMLSLRYG